MCTARSADFGPDFTVQTYNRRTWTHDGLAGVDLQPSSTLAWVETTAPGALTRSFTVDAYEPGLHPILARVPDTGEIIARGNVSAFAVYSAHETDDTRLVEILPDGTHIYGYTIIADNLPSNAEIRFLTYYAGAIYGNGSRNFVKISQSCSSVM